MILAIDVSSTKCGFCVLDKEEKIVFKDVLFFNSKESLIQRVSKFSEFCVNSLNFEIEKVIVEEPFISVTGGAGQAWTTAILHKFNAMCCYIIYQIFKQEPIMINPMSARSKLGIKIPRGLKGKHKKQVIIDFVCNYFKDQFSYEKTKFGNYIKGTDDICDAIILALYGLKFT